MRVNKKPTFFILPPLEKSTSYFVIFYIREKYNPDTFALDPDLAAKAPGAAAAAAAASALFQDAYPVKMVGVLARAHMHHKEDSIHASYSFLQNANEHNSAIESKHFENGGDALKNAIIQKIIEQREGERN